MKFFTQVALTIALSFVLQYFLPWWTIAIGAFAAGYFSKNTLFISFLAGFVGAGILWACMAYYTDIINHAIISNKVDQLFPAPALLLTAIIGGLVGGFAALTGTALKQNNIRRPR